MKRLTAISILLVLVIVLLENCRTANKPLSEDGRQLEQNILAAYGEVIYHREACNSCHTQQIAEESARRVSLDGIGGKYN